MRGMGRGIKEFKDAINKDYTAETPKNETDGSLCARCKTDRRDYQELESCRIRQGPGLCAVLRNRECVSYANRLNIMTDKQEKSSDNEMTFLNISMLCVPIWCVVFRRCSSSRSSHSSPRSLSSIWC